MLAWNGSLVPRHHDVDRLTVFARGAEPLAGNEEMRTAWGDSEAGRQLLPLRWRPASESPQGRVTGQHHRAEV